MSPSLKASGPSALALAVGLALLSLAPSAAAQQDETETFDKGLDDSLASEKQAADEEASGDKMPGEKDKPPPPEAPPADMDPFEKPHERYNFVGLRFRNVIVPEFILDLFASGGRTVNVFTFGPEFSTRKDGLEIDLALSYADYSMDDTIFKGKSDGDEAYELVSSSMKIVYFTTDLLYEIPLDKEKGRFSLLVGGGVGLGVVFGDLNRNQVYPGVANPNPDEPGDWRRCGGPNNPVTTPIAYCDASNDHYGDYSEASWFNGGSKPSVFPWISLPQISFRYKPIKQLQTRVDLGFSITGFYFGASAAYGL